MSPPDLVETLEVCESELLTLACTARGPERIRLKTLAARIRAVLKRAGHFAKRIKELSDA